VGSTLKLIRKNLKLLIRSKSSALIVIFGPMLIIFLVGLAFDNANAYSVSIGAYSDSFNELSTTFLDKLGNENFGITKFSDEISCINAVEQGDTHLCIVFPGDFEYGAKSANDLVFHVDYSKINLVYAILDTVTSQVGEKTQELSKDLTNILLTVIKDTKESIKEQKKTVGAMLIDNSDISNEVDNLKERLEILHNEVGMQAKYFKEIQNTSTWIIDQAIWVATYATQTLNSVNNKVHSIQNLSGDDSDKVGLSISQTIVKIGYLTNQMNNKSADLKGYVESVEKSMQNVESSLGDATSKGPLFEQVSTLRKKVSVTFNNLVKIQEAMNKIEDSMTNIKVTDAEDIVNPVTTTIKPVTTMSTHLNYLFPSLIVLVIMFVSVFLASTLVVMEKTSPAYFRNTITPVGDFIFLAATFLTSMILMVIQLVIIIAVSSIFFKSQIFGNMPSTFVVLLLATTLFTLIGMAIGHLFSSEETATLASISVGSVLMLISDVILPLESMPEYMMKIAQFNPFVIFEFLLRRTIIFQSHLGELIVEICYVVGYIAMLVVLVLLLENVMKHHLIKKRAKKLMPIKKGNKASGSKKAHKASEEKKLEKVLDMKKEKKK